MHQTKLSPGLAAGAIRRSLLLLLALIVGLSLCTFSPTPSYAVTSAEKQAEADDLVKQLDALQTDLDNARLKLEEAKAAEASAVKLKDEAQVREDEASERIAGLQKQLGERAEETYRNGSIGYLDVLFGASSFSEFITIWDMVTRINEHDASMTQASKQARNEAESARTLYTEQERIATQKRLEIAELEASLQQKSDDMNASLTRMNEEIAELLAQEEAAAEAARAAAAAEAGGGDVDPEIIAGLGGFVHPCPAGSISSGFGWRDFDHSFHKGLDFAAGTGTPIYAAQGGTVIISGYSGSAGNWVVIAHGNGLVTKYMHASELYVGQGQSVSAGQNIAAVGNTGNSFGAHLHFQVEINGTAMNPYPFLYG